MNAEMIRFGSLYKIPSCNGLSRPSSVRGNGFKMINMGELFDNDIINDVDMERVQLSEKEKSKYLVQKGDLLFARQSLVASGAGKCSIVNSLSEQTTFESHLIRVRLDQEKCNPWFYYYLFRLADNPIKTIVNQCAQAGIRGTELVKVKVPYIDLCEQNKVVDVLQPVLNNLQTGAAQPHVYPKHINKISVIIPRQEWINNYCDVVNPIYDQIFVLKQKNQNLIKQRNLLLPRLMSGKLEV